MDHDYIEQFDIIDRYVTNRLIAEESEQFEEHFIDCRQCLDGMKTAKGLSQGFRLFTAQQATLQQNDAVKESAWFFLHWLSRKTWAVAACGLLLVTILISILATTRIIRLRQEADQAKTATSDLQRIHEDDQQTALALARDRQEMEQNLKEQIQQLEADLQKGQSAHPDPADTSRGWAQPFINLPIVVLSSVRSSEVAEINVSHTPTNFVVSLPLEGNAKYQTYRVTVLKDQRPIWSSNDVKPDSDNALIIGFNSSFFQQGRYVLKVEGFPVAPGSGEGANYPFIINKRP